MLKGSRVPQKYYTHGGVASGPIGVSDDVTNECLQWGTKGIY